MPARHRPTGNSESVDNYLKAILALGGEEGSRVSSKALADRLGVAPASVTNMLQKLHDEAERLEHFISERFEERIAAKLGHPRIDPHGHSIPSLAGEMPAVRSVRLTDVVGPGSYAVESVSDRDPCTLRLLEAHGIRPQVRLRVMESRPEGYVVKVGRAAAEIELSRAVAGEVRVVAAAK